ncbi:nitrogen permease regulator of amino acid transport activity 3-domain-containing protein [Xylariomycetidae sp. FL2044]|nr:nitrogen permease regulator of amino acid transport activity 3-domain-containing protein [Xylariomycetidae sp. FL2044]
MSAPVLPDESNFLGVALVVNRSRDGPRFVFHYPPQILPNNPRKPNSVGKDELDDDDDDVLPSQVFEAASGSMPKSVDLQNWNHDDHLETDSGSQIVPWEHVAGYPTKDLESLLTPTRAFHKRLFQVSLDQLCFVSYPVYVPESGTWKRKKKQPKYQPPKSPEQGDSVSKNGEPFVFAGNIPQIETIDTADEGPSENAQDDAEEKKSTMTMFNLVFILNPKKHEVRELADNLYLHIIKKVNKVYKYSQEKSDFVWKESKRILSLKDKNREAKTKMSLLWKEILEASSLAASMQDVYEAVSHNKIAALQLETAEGAITHSVQIPMPFYLTDLPAAEDEPRSRGLWITTANYFIEEDSDTLNDPDFLDKNFALLLMSDEKKIVAELQADPDETTAAMVEFVRLSKPTMSFHQIGQGNALSPAQVRKYAQHFIFWRRAIAIPPLHARDVYIMSPLADTSLLPRAAQAWSRAFPLAPALPDFLAQLSAAPRPYKWFAPSKSHRPTYLSMLAWLMRGGWVTQLCTFAYVVVWPEILYEVEYELEAEEIRAEARAAEEGARRPGSGLRSRQGEEKEDEDVDDDILSTSDEEEGPLSPYAMNLENSRTITSPRSPRSPFAEPPPPPSLASTTASPIPPPTPSPVPAPSANEQFAEQARLDRLADRLHRTSAERAAAHARKPRPVATAHPSLNRAPHLAHLTPYVIPSAGRVAGRDSLYLSAIGRRLLAREREDGGVGGRVGHAWPLFWKYLDGRTALERVALQYQGAEAGGLGIGVGEQSKNNNNNNSNNPKNKKGGTMMKRKEVWGLLNGMSEFLICVRHW